ncbi:capsular polysaccharide biosynthesis protein [Nocardioides marinisabuli]|uniref:Capsular polysaccharide biosynthesis protein n=1 Tax=Nocardioides marinisabuli TaxID=419476 RepID=A0A7Y9EY37_9ACTN|nr:Wzz/FepE/Etk N-terminal domain-containing protein [Nocardioides marinisabuli]NYD55951.1 capsular polysaccharide biosynthesis protein [Nocardioides marinisabuli]
MRTSAWPSDTEPTEDPELEEVAPALVSLHFLRRALRRRWRTWAGCALAGVLLGAAIALALPPRSAASVTLLLAHPDGADPTMAMNTDVSLLRTRTVAERVVGELGLDLEPDELQDAVTATVETTTVLLLEVDGPDPAEAQRRTEAVARAFLDFRNETMAVQTEARTDRYRIRVEALQNEARTLSSQYEVLSDSGRRGRAEAAEVLTRRAQVDAQISELEQEIERTRIVEGAVAGASHVLDPTTTLDGRSLARGLALDTTAGLVVGGSVGVGWVLLGALLSQRVRRRDEIALALGTTVRCSVGRVPARVPRGGIRPGRRRRALERVVDRLAGMVAPDVAPDAGPVRWAVGSVQNAPETTVVAAALAVDRSRAGRRVLVVDLTERGLVGRAVARLWTGSGTRPVVLRPSGVPLRTVGPVPGTELAPSTVTEAESAADLVLVVVDIDPAVGLDHVAVRAERLVVVVSAGGSTAERLRTTAELVRAAGLELAGAVLVGADPLDDSLGLAPVDADEADGTGSRSGRTLLPGRWGR